MISPANSSPGLTRRVPGAAPDEPDRYYPSGLRTYARDYPSDLAQAAATALTMRSLGVRRPLVLEDDPREGYQNNLATLFMYEARKAGLRPIGPTVTPARRAGAGAVLRARLRGADAVFYASLGPANDRRSAIDHSRSMLAALHSAGRPVFLPDAYVIAAGLRSWAGAAASGAYITGGFVTDPNRQLPPAGREFVRRFSATQPGRVANYFTPYAAQATEVLLTAIAHSDGTRAGVARQLLKVRVSNGILGSFHFDRNGDIDPTLMPVFRVPPPGAPPGSDPVLRVLAIHTGVPPA